MFHVKPALYDLDDLLTGLRKLVELVDRSPAESTWTDGRTYMGGVEYRRHLEWEHQAVILAYLVWMPDTLCGDRARCLQPVGHFPMTAHEDAISRWGTSFRVGRAVNAGPPWKR